MLNWSIKCVGCSFTVFYNGSFNYDYYYYFVIALLLFSAESFVFQSAIQKVKDQDI